MTSEQRISQTKHSAIPAHFWPLVLLVFVISRLLTTIYYIEDIDSLRFAEAVVNYDLAHERPHFPGYPVYCFLVRIIYSCTDSLAISFALIGALANFWVAYFTSAIAKKCTPTVSTLVIVTLCFTNPLFWLMSNRYMPDLTGLAVMLAACHYLLLSKQETGTRILVAGLLVGILAGTRLSYVPFLIPACILALRNAQSRWYLLVFGGVLGVILWFIPLVADTGWDNLIEVANKQTHGHFYEFGGTVFNESNVLQRFWMMVQYTWADGFGAWLPGRNWITIILSAFLFYLFIRACMGLKGKKFTTCQLVLLGAVVVYGLWILLFQNVLYKSRHLLPMLPVVILFFGYGISVHRFLAGKVVAAIVLVLQLSITGVLAVQHKTPTALAQLTDYLQTIDPGKEIVIDALPIQQRYLKSQLKRPYRFRQENERVANPRERNQVYSLVSYSEREPKEVKQFFHNPYVNRMWAEMRIYIYEY